MPSPAARRGELFPGVTLPDLAGAGIPLESYRGQANLVVIFTGGSLDNDRVTALLEGLAARTEALTYEAAQVFVVVPWSRSPVPRRRRWGFPALVDDGAHLHLRMGAADPAGRPAPAVLVTDRFREIFAAYLPGRGSPLPGANDVLEWLAFINIQCPECGVPEWPT